MLRIARPAAAPHAMRVAALALVATFASAGALLPRRPVPSSAAPGPYNRRLIALVRLAAEASGRPQAPTPHGRPAYTPSPTSVASTSDTDATSLLYSNVPTIVQPVVERVGLKTDDGEDSECAAACRAPAQCQRRLTAVLCPVPAKSATGRRRTSSRPR